MLRVRLLGGLALEADSGPLDVPASRPARELLVWLALHPGPQPRFELALRFWPDVLETSARASLRTTLHELRRALGDAASHLAVDRDHVGLTDVWVDLLELSPDELLEAGGGEPLAGIDRDWAVAARDEHRERIATLLAERADGAATPEEAIRWARELVRHDPLSEEAAQRLMRKLTEAGDRAAAMSEYVRLEHRLQRELSVAPSRQTRRLLAEIRADAPPPLGTGGRQLGTDPRGGGERPTGEDGGRDASGAAPPPAAPAAPPRPEFPPALAGRRGPLAGRGAELQRLLDATHGVLLLAGEPGIGKTRLLAEAGRIAHERGATVRYGRCYEEQVAPYEPFAEALGAEAFAALVDAAGGERWRLFDGVGARLDGSVLLLDDLHWADAGSLRLLAHVLRRPDAPVVLGAYRDSEISRAHPLAGTLSDLRREQLVERVPLTGLSEPEVATLVAARNGPEQLTEALHRETGGNPFYIEEVLRHLRTAPLAAHGALPIPEGVKDVIGRRLSRLKPATEKVLAVAAVAGREFDLDLLEAVLEEDPLEALEEAAAAQMVREEPGRPGRYAFSHALVRETLYEELSLTRRVRTHRALADALETLPAPRLAEIAHHRLESAAAGGGAIAADVALAAAAEAMRGLAYEDAAALCERALAALEEGEDERRAELLLALGDAQLRAGEPAREAFAAAAGIARELGGSGDAGRQAGASGDAGRQAGASGDAGRQAGASGDAGRQAGASGDPGRQAGASGDPGRQAGASGDLEREAGASEPGAARAAELLARAALGFSGLGVTIIAVDDEAVALLEEALRALPPEHPLRARLVGRLAIETYYASTPARRKALGDEAVRLARPEGGAALLDALNARHTALWSAQYLDERLATAHEMLALATHDKDAERELQARNWLVCDLLERGDIASATEAIEGHERLAAELRLPAYTWWGPMWRSTLAILEGRFEEAKALIERFATIDHPNARLYAEIQRFVLAWHQGEFAIADLSPVDREIGRPAEYAYRCGYAWILAEVGAEDAARENIDWVAHEDFARLGDDMNRLAALAELAQAMTVLGYADHAAGALTRLEPYADRNIPNGRGAGGYGSAALHVATLNALLGRDDEAERRFEQALRANRALNSAPWLAQTRRRYAALLQDRGDDERARDLLAQAGGSVALRRPRR